MAEASASEAEIKAVTGDKTAVMVARRTNQARQETLAREAAEKVARKRARNVRGANSEDEG
jgi:hypothetical protein